MKKHTNTIEQIRADHKNIPSYDNRKAVIVSTQYAKGKYQYGVQLWTESDVQNGKVVNTDNTVANFAEFL